MIEQGDSKDVLGRAYEYYLARFAEQEGKLAGEHPCLCGQDSGWSVKSLTLSWMTATPPWKPILSCHPATMHIEIANFIILRKYGRVFKANTEITIKQY